MPCSHVTTSPDTVLGDGVRALLSSSYPSTLCEFVVMAYLNRGGGRQGAKDRKIMLPTKTCSSKHTVTGGLHTHIILLFAGTAVVIWVFGKT